MKINQVILSFHKPFLVILFMFTTLPGITTAQNLTTETKDSSGLHTYVLKKYGFDHDLVNGIQFYNIYRRVLNHPYYYGEESLPGSVTISGKLFNNLMINYDIYNQWLVLEYNEVSGGIHKIILDPILVGAFQFDGYNFKKMILDDRGPLFYQVIRVKDLTCYTHCNKQLLLTANNLEYAEYFTNPSQSFFLEYNGTISTFSNRRNFSSRFHSNSRKQIRKYMRKNSINFRKISSEELIGLLGHISLNQ